MTNATPPPLRARSAEQAGKAPAAFGGIDKSAARRGNERPDFADIQRSEEFIRLRRRLKRFVFPMTVLFLCWYIGYVVLAAYAHDFMATPLFGKVNVGIVLGVGQFVSTVVITTLYVRFATRNIDPQVERLRRDTEGDIP